MDIELRALLVGDGMPKEATDEEALAYLCKLSDEKRAQLAMKFGKSLPEGKGAAAAKQDAAQIAALASKSNDMLVTGAETLRLETGRVNLITQLGETLKVGKQVVNQCIADNLNIEQSRIAMLKAVANMKFESADPTKDQRYTVGGEPCDHEIRVGTDANLSTLRPHCVDALAMKIIAKTYDPHTNAAKFTAAMAMLNRDGSPMFASREQERTKKLAAMDMRQICRSYFAALGYKGANDLTEYKLAKLMDMRELRSDNFRVAQLAESTSDLSSITLDAFNKTLRVFYLDAPKQWPIFFRRNTAPDFKNINRVVLSESPNMVNRNQGGELKYVNLKDSKETYYLSEYIAGIKMTRRTIINDDLNALSRIPLLQANSASRQEEDTAWAVLTANATMADTGTLFNATAVTTTGGHANYTSSGSTISVSSLQTAYATMFTQKGLANAARLELRMKFLLVPSSVYWSAKQLVESDILIPGIGGGGSSGTPVAGTVNQGARNPFANQFQVVGSTRLNDSSSTAWYGMADYRDGQIDTGEVCFLEDEPEPVARQETEFDTEDLKFAIRHTIAAAALGWQGFYMNAGA